ncbi:MAG: hypothetical protein HYZ24_08820 [Chloroflexi bacterium]|nr:hypothetical protein [Chloroflexota bacterium]
MLYQLVVFLHIRFVIGFLLAHGVSVIVAFSLKAERDPQKIRFMLDLSAASYPWMIRLMWAFLIFGIIAAFMGGFQARIWPWLSLVLGFLIVVAMGLFGTNVYSDARKLLGLRYSVKGKWFPPEPAGNIEEVHALLAKVNPIMLTVVGYGGFAVIVWLMRLKPF